MIVHNFRLRSMPDEPSYRFLMSDLHLGSVNSDHDYIVADLEAAKRVGARVLVNGDVFDAICPTDKRYDAAVLHPDIRGKKDLTKAIVDMAAELLMPYRHMIDVIGIGNHEEAWIKYNHSDPVRLLLDKLNANTTGGHHIRHGSFWGWINTVFTIEGSRQRPRHKLLYLHGTGGDSPVTKGTIDFNRKGRNWDYDCLTFGHKHNLAITVEAMQDVTPGGKVIHRQQLNLQTASYYGNYNQQPEDNPLEYSYAESKGHPPKPKGGIFLVLRPRQAKDGRWFLKQDFASDIVVPFSKSKKAS